MNYKQSWAWTIGGIVLSILALVGGMNLITNMLPEARMVFLINFLLGIFILIGVCMFFDFRRTYQYRIHSSETKIKKLEKKMKKINRFFVLNEKKGEDNEKKRNKK